jgi:hypothetical protein
MGGKDMSYWAEIRNDYLCEDDKFWRIDAWETGDDSEDGKVIAYVDDLTGRVLYVNPLAIVDDYAQEVIQETVDDVNKAIAERKRNFYEDYNNDPIVQDGWHQQDIIDMYRRER